MSENTPLPVVVRCGVQAQGLVDSPEGVKVILQVRGMEMPSNKGQMLPTGSGSLDLAPVWTNDANKAEEIEKLLATIDPDGCNFTLATKKASAECEEEVGIDVDSKALTLLTVAKGVPMERKFKDRSRQMTEKVPVVMQWLFPVFAFNANGMEPRVTSEAEVSEILTLTPKEALSRHNNAWSNVDKDTNPNNVPGALSPVHHGTVSFLANVITEKNLGTVAEVMAELKSL